jgi:thiamine phosphate synthase YjbQ (UPF0047 family)
MSSITVLRVVGSTAAIDTIEFEPGLQHHRPAILDKLIPPSRNYGHEQMWNDGNGDTRIHRRPYSRHRSPYPFLTADSF